MYNRYVIQPDGVYIKKAALFSGFDWLDILFPNCLTVQR